MKALLSHVPLLATNCARYGDTYLNELEMQKCLEDLCKDPVYLLLRQEEEAAVRNRRLEEAQQAGEGDQAEAQQPVANDPVSRLRYRGNDFYKANKR